MSQMSRNAHGYLRCPKSWTAEQRLAHHTRRDPLSGCLIWQCPPNALGYGQVRFRQRTMLAHRWAWMILRGPIPQGAFLCHRCDERRCVNPDHLFLGTHEINMADLKAKRMWRHEALASSNRGGGSTGRKARRWARTPDIAPIRILYRGVELVGEVALRPVDSPEQYEVARRASARARARRQRRDDESNG